MIINQIIFFEKLIDFREPRSIIRDVYLLNLLKLFKNHPALILSAEVILINDKIILLNLVNEE